MQSASRNNQRLAGLLWGAIPLAAYALVLRHLWFNAPIWDDYDAILDSVARLLDAGSLREWLGALVAQHNEHRIAVVRFVAWGLAMLTGAIDIRLLVAIGNLTLVGILLLAWAEFRDVVAPPLFAAAGFLMFQWSYYEATLMGSAALPNVGVVFFAFASLFLALRPGAAAAAGCVVFGILAAGSQANGLFALPLAVVACALLGHRRRAAALGVVALVLWGLYFLGYSRPPAHPSILAAFSNPVGAAHLFTIIIGGVAPLGVALLVVLAWLAGKGVWKSHPTAALWVAFVVISAAAATAGRIGFGVFHASRYAIYSTSLAVIAFLAVCAVLRPPRSRAALGAVIAAAAMASATITWVSWPRAVEYSRQGRLLAKLAGTQATDEARYVGVLYPSHPLASRFLLAAEQRGLYSPPERAFGAAQLRSLDSLPPVTQAAGFVDQVQVEGRRLRVIGWTHIPAATPGRVFSVYPGGGTPSAMSAFITARPDVAKVTGDERLTYSGFRLELDYATDQEAARVAPTLCVFVDAPGQPLTVLARMEAQCRPGGGR